VPLQMVLRSMQMPVQPRPYGLQASLHLAPPLILRSAQSLYAARLTPSRLAHSIAVRLREDSLIRRGLCNLDYTSVAVIFYFPQLAGAYLLIITNSCARNPRGRVLCLFSGVFSPVVSLALSSLAGRTLSSLIPSLAQPRVNPFGLSPLGPSLL
jgi:hypothetical protein